MSEDNLYHNSDITMRTDYSMDVKFYHGQQEVGRLWFDEGTETWHFEGDKEKSAVEFVAFLRTTFRQQLQEQQSRLAAWALFGRMIASQNSRCEEIEDALPELEGGDLPHVLLQDSGGHPVIIAQQIESILKIEKHRE